MARVFQLPDVGEGLTEAEIVRWHVSVGDEISVDQALVEVETAKSVVELPSPYAGTVLHLGGVEGEMLPVGAVVVAVGQPGERWPDAGPPADVGSVDVRNLGANPPPRAAAPAAPIVGTLSEQAQLLTAAVPEVVVPYALPLVRKLARTLGVDLHAVRGTGLGGRITRDDVTAAATPITQPVALSHGRSRPPQTLPSHGDSQSERRPLSRLRRAIAANLARAWSEIPAVTAFDEVDATRMLAARAALADRHGVKVPIDAFVVAAVVPALRAHPDFNSSLDGDTLVVHHCYDVGIAVDTPDGLMVAVVVDAGSKSLMELAHEVRRLGEGARARSLTASELTGQTFTVSNIGAMGGGYGTPLVPHGTVGLLSVGRVAQRPAVRNGALEVAPVMPLSLSYDHRIIDGGAGRRFLAMVAEHLAEPVLFLA